MRVHGTRMGNERAQRLDHLEVHVRHIAETGTRIIRVATTLCDQGACFYVPAALDIELSDMAVQERDRIALVVLEHIRHDDRCPTLGEAGDGPVGDPVAVPEVTA